MNPFLEVNMTCQVLPERLFHRELDVEDTSLPRRYISGPLSPEVRVLVVSLLETPPPVVNFLLLLFFGVGLTSGQPVPDFM